MAFGRRRAAQAQVAMADGGATPAAAQARGGRGRLRVAPDPVTEVIGERASNGGVLLFSVVLFALAFAAVLAAGTAATGGVGPATVALAVLLAALAVSACHIAQQWERVVVLRLGKFNRVSGPGLFWTWPVIESNTMRVDTRTRVTSFGAEETLTADLVPLDVNAVLFWHVWDARAACTEVGDFTRAVELAAQTALRDAIGRAGAAEVAIRREQLDRELKRVLEEKVAAWGVTILSVEVRDILVPPELQEVMSLEAQAEQRKKARIILMEAEQDIAELMEEMGDFYAANDAALRLRAMHLLYESVRETGGTIVVPSSFSEGFGDVLPDTLRETLGR
ncbi:slipin family protein [Adlercreutzia faecimuris]|uniref:Slipin family protein n=1 Tax=Adlercreutzia faecimuris TaxID=2897341 RepID=A0ABS9WHU0_9ACTN|nr:slipin family protein [Adlercreutzia sp. JBNU-10]MCI2242433.1 slipin family protein [Adlercreutzia sp. JBNU-10]